jgi:hypothetical protein
MKENFYHGYNVTGTADYNGRNLSWRAHSRIRWNGGRQEANLHDPQCFKSREEAEDFAIKIGRDWVDQRFGSY